MADLTTAEAAVWYVQQNLAVYPANGKRALIKGWNTSAAARDPERARHFFETEFPEASVGLACGPSKLVVVDIDPRNGGDASFRKLTDEVGLEAFDGAPTTETPSGGSHIYFRSPAVPVKSGTHALGRGIDIVSAGQGVIAPPSMRAGGSYAWRGGFPETFEPRQLPESILERIRVRARDRAVKAIASQFAGGLTAGERNDGLCRIAGIIHWRCGFSELHLRAALIGLNEVLCHPPLPQSEVNMIAKSISARPLHADPVLWLKIWTPDLSFPELRVANALVCVAEFVAGPLTPAAALMTERTGMKENKYYEARKKLETRGALRVTPRSTDYSQAPLIELLQPQDTHPGSPA